MHASAQCDDPTGTSDRIKAIAADVFQLDAASIDLEMGPDDIESWDSLNHLRLITEVESAFSVRLTMKQIQEIESLGDLAQFVSDSAS